MKKVIFSVFCLLLLTTGFAQSSEEKNEINFYPKIKEHEKLFGASYRKLLANVNRILLTNSQGATEDSRFVLRVSVDVEDETIVPTSPPMYKEVLQVQLIIEDELEKRVYGNYTYTNLVGVNPNKNKATALALSKVVPNKKVQKFIEDSKNKIYDYYKNDCNFIITEASNLAEQGNYDGAISKLNTIPTISEDCFYMAQSKISEIAKVQQEKQNEKVLMTKELDTLVESRDTIMGNSTAVKVPFPDIESQEDENSSDK